MSDGNLNILLGDEKYVNSAPVRLLKALKTETSRNCLEVSQGGFQTNLGGKFYCAAVNRTLCGLAEKCAYFCKNGRFWRKLAVLAVFYGSRVGSSYQRSFVCLCCIANRIRVCVFASQAL